MLSVLSDRFLQAAKLFSCFLLGFVPFAINAQAPTIAQIEKYSKNLTGETVELRFLLRVLPDNGWFLELRDDGTYVYRYWSGWGESEGTILECGTYTIVDNLIKLETAVENQKLNTREFFLTTSEIPDFRPVDCDNYRKKTYCLYRP